MNAQHERSRVGQRLGHRQLSISKLFVGIVQIELIEHAVLPVASQLRPVLVTEGFALTEQTCQVGLRRQLFG